MAEVAFRYVNSHTVFHRTDPRIKLLLLIGCTVVGAGRGWPGLLALTICILAGMFLVRVPVRQLLLELRGFLIFFGFIVLISTFRIDAGRPGIPVYYSPAGLETGLLVVARMAFVILAGVLFTSVTRTREMRDAVWWLFDPVPHVNAARLATMFSLSIRFIPIVFEEAGAIRQALFSRALSGSGRPLRRLRSVGFPLVVRAFRRADHIATAIESRAYDEQRDPPRLRLALRDVAALILIAAIGAAAIAVDRWL